MCLAVVVVAVSALTRPLLVSAPPEERFLVVPAAVDDEVAGPVREKRGLLLGAGLAGAGLLGAGLLGAGVVGAGVAGAGLAGAGLAGAGLGFAAGFVLIPYRYT